MKYKTAAGFGIGSMVVVIVINISILAAIGFVAWHFIKKWW